MIVGISESFNPLYFFTDIKSDSEGEIIINYKKGGNIVYSAIVDKTKDDITEWKGIQNNIYDIYNKKITFNKQNTSSEICTKGCRLYIGIYVYDYEVGDPNDFSFFLRYTDEINDKTVSILPNELVFGTLEDNKNDSYNITILKDTKEIDIQFDDELCNLTVTNDDLSFSGSDKNIRYLLRNH